MQENNQVPPVGELTADEAAASLAFATNMSEQMNGMSSGGEGMDNSSGGMTRDQVRQEVSQVVREEMAGIKEALTQMLNEDEDTKE